METALSIVRLSTQFLEERGIPQPRREAEDLIGGALGIPRLELYLSYDRPLSDEELQRCRQFLRRRISGEPTAYILGYVTFHGCALSVTPEVLIPRPETEILVALVADTLKEQNLENKTLWDLCTGSGCIAIALKKRFPALTVIGSDLSSDALLVADRNAKRNNVDIEWRQGDLLEPFAAETTFFVTCNPPYISQQEWEALDEEVRLHEPKTALIGGPSGIEFYRRLAAGLPHHLPSNGKLWLEIAYHQGKMVSSLFTPPNWHPAEIASDWAGHDRFVLVRRK